MKVRDIAIAGGAAVFGTALLLRKLARMGEQAENREAMKQMSEDVAALKEITYEQNSRMEKRFADLDKHAQVADVQIKTLGMMLTQAKPKAEPPVAKAEVAPPVAEPKVAPPVAEPKVAPPVAKPKVAQPVIKATQKVEPKLPEDEDHGFWEDEDEDYGFWGNVIPMMGVGN
jgi:uncharacterized membrane protein